MSKSFAQRLREQQAAQNSLVCVGLDTNPMRIPACVTGATPAERMEKFNYAIVPATWPFASAFKLNLSFYVRCAATSALVNTIASIHENCPGAIVILDAKWGDVGDSAEAYAVTAFDTYGADAVTLNPYPGRGMAMEVFLERPDRGAIFLCRTSNPGARELQDLPIFTGLYDANGVAITEPYWLRLGRLIATEWDGNQNVALVMGATFPAELRRMRETAPNGIILSPGFGKQAKDAGLANPIQEATEAGQDADGFGMIDNNSRALIFASTGEDFAEAAACATEQFRDEINSFRHQLSV